MNISQRVMWIVGIPTAIGASIAGIGTIVGVIKSGFWNRFNPWHVVLLVFFVILIGLGINWLQDRLNARFKYVAEAFGKLRTELREGPLSTKIKELEGRVATLEKARTGTE